MKKFVISFIVLSLVFLFCSASFAEQTGFVYSITMTKNSAGYITTRGMVKNISSKPIKGYVDIDFLNANGDVVYSMSAYVNKNRYIPVGKSAFFLNAIHEDTAPGVQDVRVEFHER